VHTLHKAQAHRRSGVCLTTAMLSWASPQGRRPAASRVRALALDGGEPGRVINEFNLEV
jgi:hypothetical protein